MKALLLVSVLLLGGCAGSPARRCPGWFSLSLMESLVGMTDGPAHDELNECKNKPEEVK